MHVFPDGEGGGEKRRKASYLMGAVHLIAATGLRSAVAGSVAALQFAGGFSIQVRMGKSIFTVFRTRTIKSGAKISPPRGAGAGADSGGRRVAARVPGIPVIFSEFVLSF